MDDENEATTIDPEKARFFNFNYIIDGKNLGNVTASLVDGTSLKVFYSTDITANMDEKERTDWYALLRDLRMLAKTYRLQFDVRDIRKDILTPKDMKFVSQKAKKKDELGESRVVWNRRGKFSEGNLNNVRIHVVHSEKMDENTNNRLLKVDRIYLVNESGEKFLLPFKYVTGAKAMANHVSQGGNPYDASGQTIIRAVNEMRNLQRFALANRTKTFENENAFKVIEASRAIKESIKGMIKRMSNKTRFAESLEELQKFMGENAEPTTQIKDWFVQSQYNENLDQWMTSASWAYQKFEESNMINEGGNDVASKIKDPNWKLVLKNDPAADQMVMTGKYNDGGALLRKILQTVSDRLSMDDSDVANFASQVGDDMSVDMAQDTDAKLAVALAKRYMDDLKKMKSNPEYEQEVRVDSFGTRKTLKKKEKSPEQEFESAIMGLGEESDGASVEDITDAISHRMMHTGVANEVLKKFGLDRVLDAISSVAHHHEGAHELGSSDISIMVKQVMQELGMNEGNQFSGALAKAKASHKDEFEVDGKTYKVKEAEHSSDSSAASPFSGNDAPVKECNMTAEGEHCPVHGMKECAGYMGESLKLLTDIRKLAGLNENYVYAQEEEDEEETEMHGDSGEHKHDEYDGEADMAKDDLTGVERAAGELKDILDADEDMPEWVQAKITKAADYLDTANDTMQNRHEQGKIHHTGDHEEGMAEESGKKPDADNDGIPDWADKNPNKKGDDEDRKETNESLRLLKVLAGI